MRIKIRRQLRDETGTTAIEFALCLTIFLAILMGLFDLGRMMIIQNALDTAAREAARFGSTGAQTGSTTRAQSITDLINQNLTTYGLGLVDPTKVLITVSSYASLTNVAQPEPYTDLNNDGKYTGTGQVGGPEPFTDINGNGVWDADQGSVGNNGTSGKAVQYVISYNWPSLLSLFSPSGVVTLTARAAVTNESF